MKAIGILALAALLLAVPTTSGHDDHSDAPGDCQETTAGHVTHLCRVDVEVTGKANHSLAFTFDGDLRAGWLMLFTVNTDAPINATLGIGDTTAATWTWNGPGTYGATLPETGHYWLLLEGHGNVTYFYDQSCECSAKWTNMPATLIFNWELDGELLVEWQVKRLDAAFQDHDAPEDTTITGHLYTRNGTTWPSDYEQGEAVSITNGTTMALSGTGTQYLIVDVNGIQDTILMLPAATKPPEESDLTLPDQGAPFAPVAGFLAAIAAATRWKR